jgi:dimeric dUTPase (all-alpha-NTP-PPase superfamily)
MELIAKKLESMFTLQNALNIHTNGEFWATNHKNEKTGKVINWRRAIWLELAEFVDSFDWKHWKHGKNDLDNAKTELVDIWHFMLSATLSEHLKESLFEIRKDIEASIEIKYNLSEDTLEMGEAMIQKVLDTKRALHFKESIDDYSAYCIFFNLCSSVKLTFDELYQRYIVKNTLNEFRQNNGYNDGTYIKVWEGKEDNVVALELAEKLSEKLDRNTLMDRLTKHYKTLK